MNYHRKNSGQVLVLGLVMVVILLFAIFFFFDIHNVIRGKIKLETAEQATALAAARWQAESLNLVGELNLLAATERILLEDIIDIPDAMKAEEVSNITRGTARVTAINEMQSRVTFIGPLIALAAAQQTAKNNGITPVKETGNSDNPQNVADDFAEYQNKLNDEKNIYSSTDNLNINGYSWKEPYKKILQEIMDIGIAARPSGMVVGIEGVDPSYLADESLYSAIIACSRGYPAWCHWRLRQLIKMDDAYFEGIDWYSPDFQWIKFSQQSEIYPLDVVLNTFKSKDPTSDQPGEYERFSDAALALGYQTITEDAARNFHCKFYHYNHRWLPDSATYNGPVVSDDSPWRRGIYLRRNVADYAVYGGAMAYAECVEHVPGTIPFSSAYSVEQANRISQGKAELNREKGKVLVKKYSDSTIQVGGNYSIDRQNSGCVAKPVGRLKNDANPVSVPIVLPVFDRVNLIPSTMQNIRIFSYNWPIVEQFVTGLKKLIDAGKEIYDTALNDPSVRREYFPEEADHMLEALRLLGTKEFRRSGYNPEFKKENLTRSDLIKLFDSETRLYHPVENPRGPGWLQQPLIYYGRNKYNLPEDALERKIYYYDAEIAKELNAKRGKNTPPYVIPPAGETWMFYNGQYIRMKGDKFFDNMEKDPYNGCGVLPCRCNNHPCTCKGKYPAGTNNGPSRL